MSKQISYVGMIQVVRGDPPRIELADFQGTHLQRDGLARMIATQFETVEHGDVIEVITPLKITIETLQ